MCIYDIHTNGGDGINIFISATSEQPLYEQIVQQIRMQVLQGKLKDGDQLPSIRTLAKDLQVSIITTKRAYEELEREGLLSVSTGRGTFIHSKGLEAGMKFQLDEVNKGLADTAEKAKAMGIKREDFAEIALEAYDMDNE